VPVDPSIHVLLELPASVTEAVLAMADACERTDGSPPLSEETLLQLRSPDSRVLHLLAGSDSADPDGYGFLRHAAHPPVGEITTAAELEFMVAPDRRGNRAGTALLGRALVEAGDNGLMVWAHGTLPAARRLAETNGLVPVRELLRLGRAVLGTSGDAPADPAPPAGFELRSFRPGDEGDLLAVNAAAFAGHPEQGALSAAGLADRMAEPWFDPDGLLLAVRPADDGHDRLVGFNWTKIEQAAPDAATPDGEVYVLGVHPDAAGHGLGSFLLKAGLAFLARRGVARVHLYVEADNAVARRLYEKAGFIIEVVDTRYSTAS
jgi:mycothiol synthase